MATIQSHWFCSKGKISVIELISVSLLFSTPLNKGKERHSWTLSSLIVNYSFSYDKLGSSRILFFLFVTRSAVPRLILACKQKSKHQRSVLVSINKSRKKADRVKRLPSSVRKTILSANPFLFLIIFLSVGCFTSWGLHGKCGHMVACLCANYYY